MKTLKNHAYSNKRKTLRFTKTRDLIPLKSHLGNGIFETDRLYTKVFEFENLNFKLLGKAQEEQILKKWCSVLNGLEPGVAYKYTIIKTATDIEKWERERLLPLQDDDKNTYREEYNNMLLNKITSKKMIDEKRYLQITVSKNKPDEIRSFYNRTIPEISKYFREAKSNLTSVNPKEYLRSIYSFLNPKTQSFFDRLDVEKVLNYKKSIRDFLAPASYKHNNSQSYIQIGDKYYRSLYIPPNTYAKYIKTTVLDEMTSLNKDMAISVDILPIESVEAMNMVESLEFRSERNIAGYMQRQAKNGNFSPQLPFSMRKKSEQIEEYQHDLNERDQRLMLSHITILHSAYSLQELNEDTATLKQKAQNQGCELETLTLQQEDGFITAMPFGVNRFIDKDGSRLRTLTTEAMASFIPFTVQEVTHPDGIYYGVNTLTQNPIFINRKEGMNGNCVILGSSGSGKSFKKKEEQLSVILNSGDKVIIIDPEKEYSYLVEKMGGQVVHMSADSKDYINAMEISDMYNDGKDPIRLKAETILNLYAMAEGCEEPTSGDKSILDRCITSVYKRYFAERGEQPTLLSLRDELLKQDEDRAKKIALTLELYTTGSLNLFSKHTNVDMSKDLISFDISELGDNLMPIAMLIITDYIMLTLSKNRENNRHTWVDIDELYLMFLKEYTAIFFYKLWKRIRKYGGLCTGMTQELSDLLKSKTAKTLLVNSDFLIMLSASNAEAQLIQDLFNLDDAQMEYFTEVGQKNGMIKLGKDYIPFTDDFPKNTTLYKIMSTKFNENIK